MEEYEEQDIDDEDYEEPAAAKRKRTSRGRACQPLHQHQQQLEAAVHQQSPEGYMPDPGAYSSVPGERVASGLLRSGF